MVFIITLGKTLRWWMTETVISDNICIDSIEYRDLGRGDWTGFYDFLRTRDGRIIGIRYAPLLDDASLLSHLRGKPYASVLPNATVELFFSTDRSFVPEFSSHQDFVDNMIFRSDSGAYALTFGPDALNPSQPDQFQGFAARL